MVPDLLLSIVIPTRNRYHTCRGAIDHILSLPDQDIQLVIQDNSDSRHIQEYIEKSVKDPRLKYRYDSEELSFVETFSRAIALADGEYVLIIGDDDGVNPEIMHFVRYMQMHGIEAATPRVHTLYTWPDVFIKRGRAHGDIKGGTFKVTRPTGKLVYANPAQELNKLLKNGGQSHLSLRLPKLYHGIVKKYLLEEIKTRTGAYFGGLTPDIYSVAALSLVAERVAYFDYPLTIPGIGNNSGSMDSATGKHIGVLEEAPHFRGHIQYHWSERVPAFYSVETIWADSLLAAINEMGRPDLAERFNVARLSAYCLRAPKMHRRAIWDCLEREIQRKGYPAALAKVAAWASYVPGPGFDLSKAAYHVMFKRQRFLIHTDGVETISKAAELLCAELKRQGLRWEG